MFIETPALREALSAVRTDSDNDDQRRIVNAFYRTNLYIRQNRHLQIELGIIDQETSSAIGGVGLYQFRDFREFWSAAKANYEPGFQEYFERVVLSQPSTAE